MPLRIDVERGSEHFLPFAKKKLRELKVSGVPSKMIYVDDGSSIFIRSGDVDLIRIRGKKGSFYWRWIRAYPVSTVQFCSFSHEIESSFSVPLDVVTASSKFHLLGVSSDQSTFFTLEYPNDGVPAYLAMYKSGSKVASITSSLLGTAWRPTNVGGTQKAYISGNGKRVLMAVRGYPDSSYYGAYVLDFDSSADPKLSERVITVGRTGGGSTVGVPKLYGGDFDPTGFNSNTLHADSTHIIPDRKLTSFFVRGSTIFDVAGGDYLPQGLLKFVVDDGTYSTAWSFKATGGTNMLAPPYPPTPCISKTGDVWYATVLVNNSFTIGSSDTKLVVYKNGVEVFSEETANGYTSDYTEDFPQALLMSNGEILNYVYGGTDDAGQIFSVAYAPEGVRKHLIFGAITASQTSSFPAHLRVALSNAYMAFANDVDVSGSYTVRAEPSAYLKKTQTFPSGGANNYGQIFSLRDGTFYFLATGPRWRRYKYTRFPTDPAQPATGYDFTLDEEGPVGAAPGVSYGLYNVFDVNPFR